MPQDDTKSKSGGGLCFAPALKLSFKKVEGVEGGAEEGHA